MNDLQIVELFWDRNESAIQEAQTKYGAYCAAVASHILDSREDIEECVSDAFLGAWNAIPPHRPEVLSAFLGKLTRRLCLKKLRQSGAQKRGAGALRESFEELSESNLRETRDYFLRSFDERQKDSPTYQEGNRKTLEVLDHLGEYRFVGGVLRSGGTIVGASLGEVQGDTLFTHIERADVERSGVYQKLTNLFTNAFAGDGVVYVNREEDDGDEGLRKAKLAYHPHQLLDKYFVEIG